MSNDSIFLNKFDLFYFIDKINFNYKVKKTNLTL